MLGEEVMLGIPYLVIQIGLNFKFVSLLMLGILNFPTLSIFLLDFFFLFFFETTCVIWLVAITLYNVLFNCLTDRIMLHAGVSREFRVVRDNRVNRSLNREAKPASTSPTPPSTFENISGKGYTITSLPSLSFLHLISTNRLVSKYFLWMVESNEATYL